MVPKSSYGPPILNSNRFECPPGTSGFRASSADCCVQLPKTICFTEVLPGFGAQLAACFPRKHFVGPYAFLVGKSTLIFNRQFPTENFFVSDSLIEAAQGQLGSAP